MLKISLEVYVWKNISATEKKFSFGIVDLVSPHVDIISQHVELLS